MIRSTRPLSVNDQDSNRYTLNHFLVFYVNNNIIMFVVKLNPCIHM